MNKNVLLVHGAFHDERCWRKLRSFLDAKGFCTSAISLRGHGANRFNSYRVSMATYADDVCEAAREFGEPCAVVGHSMGGVVISAAAEKFPEFFSGMIYLAALVPQRESSLMALHKQFPNDRLAKSTTPSIKGHATVSRAEAKAIFYGMCDSAAQNEAVELLCPQPIRPSFSKIEWTDARLGSVPKHYIECTEDQAIFIDDQRALQSHMQFSRIETLICDHSPFWFMPEKLAEVIADLVR